MGNTEIGRLFSTWGIQAKLRVNTSGDTYEQQADKVAKDILKNHTPEDNSLKIGTLQRQNNGITVPTEAAAQINSLQGQGTPLSRPVSEFPEPRFGVDLEHVRLHNSKSANNLADEIQAKAFTHGNDIVFAKGEYKPDTKEGMSLLAHELTHVVQQQNSQEKSTTIQRNPISNPPKNRTQIIITLPILELKNTITQYTADNIELNNQKRLEQYVNIKITLPVGGIVHITSYGNAYLNSGAFYRSLNSALYAPASGTNTVMITGTWPDGRKISMAKLMKFENQSFYEILSRKHQITLPDNILAPDEVDSRQVYDDLVKYINKIPKYVPEHEESQTSQKSQKSTPLISQAEYEEMSKQEREDYGWERL